MDAAGHLFVVVVGVDYIKVICTLINSSILNVTAGIVTVLLIVLEVVVYLVATVAHFAKLCDQRQVWYSKVLKYPFKNNVHVTKLV